MIIILIILSVIGFFAIAGYIFYKFDNSATWEAGVSDFVKALIQLGRAIFFDDLQPQAPEVPLFFTPDEAVDLANCFCELYISPTLTDFSPNLNGVVWFYLSAGGLRSPYLNCDFETLSRIASLEAKKYFQQTRQISPDVFVRLAEPKRLVFGIPLTEAAWRMLDQDIRQRKEAMAKEISVTVQPLTEEILPIWDDEPTSPENTQSPEETRVCPEEERKREECS